MTAEDIPAGLELCRAAGWNQVRADWELYLRQNPAGARVLERAGRVVGTVITLDFQGRFGWIGMVLVHPAFRKRGLGTRLMSMALESLRTCETAKLDATPAGQPVYRALDFSAEYPLLRMERDGGCAHVPMPLPPGVQVRPMAGRDLGAVLEWDWRVFGADRSAVLRTVHELEPRAAWVALRAGRIAGYLLGRRGHVRDQAGPLVATELPIAGALLARRLAEQPGPCQVDAALHDPRWLAWLQAAGFHPQRPYLRMFRGPNRFPGQPHLQYVILGPELG